jgi:lipoate-protein ligase A
MTPILYSETAHPYPTGEDIVDPDVEPFRVWIPEQPIVVLGYSQEPEAELRLDAIEADKIPVYKRKGGGGAVVLSPGVVCVALRLKRKPGFGIQEYFSAANGKIQEALQEELGIALEPRGISDLAWKDRKVLGSSLHLPRECAVYLASILVDADLSLLDRWLRHPGREPDYRNKRMHGEFVTNLSAIVKRADIVRADGRPPQQVLEILEKKLATWPDLD